MPTVVCEKHHLRYDAQTQPGCVLCRKEAVAAGVALPHASSTVGGTAAAISARPSPTAVSAALAASPADSPSGIGAPLALAASIWLVSAMVLYGVHQRIAAAYVLDQAEEEAAMLAEEETSDQGAPMPASGTAAGQTDAVLQEIRALSGDEAPAYPTGAPPAIPSSERLSPEQGPEDDEHPSTEPVEIETSGSDGG